MTTPARVPTQRLTLAYPMSLGVYPQYEDAQRAVDYLADHQFPVENCMIVGTDLKQMERVTGRLTTGKVLTGGLLSGMWLGLFVGAIFALFAEGWSLPAVASTVMMGGIFGVVWAGIGYSLTRGKRDFTSVSQVVATRYEVLVEHKLFPQGRDLLAQMPGGAGAPVPPTAVTTTYAPAAPPQAAASPVPEPDPGQPEPRPRPQYGEYAPTPPQSGGPGDQRGPHSA